MNFFLNILKQGKLKDFFGIIYKKTSLKYCVTRKKIEDFFSPVFNKKISERGVLPLLMAMGAFKVIVAVGTIGGMIWASSKVASFIEGDTEFFESLMAAAAAFLTDVSQAWLVLSTDALTFAIKGFLTENITGTATSLAGWALTRDLANMFIVLGFVVIGIAFTLRLESYGSKKVLISLIMVALLINFSPLICGVIIDASNLLINFLLQSSNPSGMILEFQDLSKNMVTSVLASQPTVAQNVHEQLGISVTVLFINLMIIVSFFTYAALIILRYVLLTILFMFSPLAFVCHVFPFSQKFAKIWWDNFIKWCFIGAIGFFFIWFAVSMLNFWQSQATYQETSPGYWELVASYGIYHVLVIFIILMAGYKFTKATSAMGASMAIGLVAGVAGVARGKITGGAKKLGGKALQKLRGEKPEKDDKLFANARTRIAETFGYAQHGSAAKQRQQQASTAEKQIEAMRTSSAVGDRQRYEQLVRTGTGAMGAAAVNVANQKGDLDRITGGNLNAKNQRVTYSTQFGYERGTFDDKDHRQTAFNEPKVRRDLVANGLTQAQADAVAPGSAQYIASQQRVVASQLEKNWGKLDQNERQNIDVLDLTPEFLRKRKSSDLEPFTLLPAGHATRTHLHSLVSPAGAPLNPALPLEARLQTAITAGDTSEVRRLTSLRTKLQTM